MYRPNGANGKLPRWSGGYDARYSHGGGGPASSWGQPHGRGGGASFRLVVALFLVSLVLGSTTVHKVFVCDPQLEAAAGREAQLLSSLKRLQGSLALRATGGDSPTTFTGAASSPGLTLADKVAYDRKVADKELQAQRAHREAAACEAQLLALARNVSASGDGAVAAAAAAAASAASHTEVKALRKAARAADSRAARAERAMVEAQLQLKAARMEVVQLSQRLRLPLAQVGRGQPVDGVMEPPAAAD